MTAVMPYAAFLRIYEPLEALPEEERGRWQAYVDAGRAPEPAAGAHAEHVAGLKALVTIPPQVVPDEGEHAFVRLVDGRRFVCPLRTRLRSWEALEEFRDGLPEELADAFLPRGLADIAELAHARFQAGNPEVRSAIRTCTWQVPVPWFVLFEQGERRLRLQAGEGRRALVYLTQMSRARRRAARALAVLRRTLEDGPAVDGVEDLGRWLEEFHPHSMVELDYAGLVGLVDDATLAADESVAEVAASLARLADGDGRGALSLYERVQQRWSALAAIETSN